jgi:hypothetical protein
MKAGQKSSMLKPAITLLFAASLMFAAPPGQPVTVVLDFDQPHSEQSLSVMEKEVATLMKDTGVTFDWRMQRDLPPEASFGDVLVFRMKGTCAMEVVPMPIDERGPLGMAFVSDGEVLSFGAVECDRVRRAVNRVIPSHRKESQDSLFGRAMGRVVAHEIYHMLAGKERHTGSGVTRSALTADELTVNQINLDESAIEAVRHRH